MLWLLIMQLFILGYLVYYVQKRNIVPENGE